MLLLIIRDFKLRALGEVHGGFGVFQCLLGRRKFADLSILCVNLRSMAPVSDEQ